VSLGVTETEFSPDCIAAAATHGVELLEGGIEAALSLERRFDMVIMSHVFEHLPDLPAAMRELSRLLAADGLLYIEALGIFSVHRRFHYRCDWVSFVTHAHLHHFSMAGLANVLRSGGFKLVSGNEEVEAVFRMAEPPVGEQTLAEDSRLVAFTTAYLAMLAADRGYLGSEGSSLLQRIDALTAMLDRSRQAVAYYEDRKRSVWWLSKQIIKRLVPSFGSHSWS
jgi:SAM-dependent methyltransferase